MTLRPESGEYVTSAGLPAECSDMQRSVSLRVNNLEHICIAFADYVDSAGLGARENDRVRYRQNHFVFQAKPARSGGTIH